MASSSSSASASTSAPPAVCASCEDALTLPSEDTEEPIIDDVALACGCHFHWDCITSAFSTSAPAQSCPACGKSVLNANGHFLVNVVNEGGLTKDFDMGKELEEENLDPIEKRNQVFLQFVAQGELQEVERLLVQDEGMGTQDVNHADKLGVTALHIAASNDDVDAVELLLKHGASKEAKSADGATPFDCARVTGSQAAALLLQQ